jgi:hypothetical protein
LVGPSPIDGLIDLRNPDWRANPKQKAFDDGTLPGQTTPGVPPPVPTYGGASSSTKTTTGGTALKDMLLSQLLGGSSQLPLPAGVEISGPSPREDAAALFGGGQTIQPVGLPEGLSPALSGAMVGSDAPRGPASITQALLAKLMARARPKSGMGM